MAMSQYDENDDDTEDSGERTPDSSVAARPLMSDMARTDAVKQAVMASQAPKDPKDIYSSDPLFKQFQAKQAELQSQRLAQNDTNLNHNLSQAFSNFSRGASAPVASDAFYNTLGQQGKEALKGSEDDQHRQQQVIAAIEQRKSREDVAKQHNDTVLQQGEATRASLAQRARERAQDMSARADDRSDAQDEKQNIKWASQMKDDLDPNKARGGNMASNQKRIDNADRVNALLAQVHNNPDPRQMEELAISTQALLSSSGSPAAEQVKALIPHTAMGSAQAFKEWLMNDPQGTNQQAFVSRMAETVQREQEVARNQVQKAQKSRLSAYGKFKDADPDTYNSIINSYGLGKPEPEEPKPKSPSSVAAATSGSSEPSGKVRMLAPDGSVRLVPAEQVGAALQAGGKKL